MAKKNYYAVKGSLEPQIYNNWAACSKAVHGVKGAIFKGFVTKEEAEEFLNAGKRTSEKSNEVRVYVDGSFSNANAHAGWGFVAVKDNKEIFSASGVSKEPALSRNIDGELQASIEAILWAEKENIEITICHDYEGIGRWATGEWKANSEVAKQYVDFIRKHKVPHFVKVSAHSGNKWNDRADELASEKL